MKNMVNGKLFKAIQQKQVVVIHLKDDGEHIQQVRFYGIGYYQDVAHIEMIIAGTKETIIQEDLITVVIQLTEVIVMVQEVIMRKQQEVLFFQEKLRIREDGIV